MTFETEKNVEGGARATLQLWDVLEQLGLVQGSECKDIAAKLDDAVVELKSKLEEAQHEGKGTQETVAKARADTRAKLDPHLWYVFDALCESFLAGVKSTRIVNPARRVGPSTD